MSAPHFWLIFDTDTQKQVNINTTASFTMFCYHRIAPRTLALSPPLALSSPLVLVLLIEPFLSSASLNSVCFAQRRGRKGGKEGGWDE